MARHAVKNLRPKKRIPKNLAYWASVAANYKEPSTMKEVALRFLQCKLPKAESLGECMVDILLHAEAERQRLTTESMDSLIQREGKQKKKFAIGMFSMSYAHWVLKVELGDLKDPNMHLEIWTWLQNMFNFVALYAAQIGYEPIIDCLEPVLRRLQK